LAKPQRASTPFADTSAAGSGTPVRAVPLRAAGEASNTSKIASNTSKITEPFDIEEVSREYFARVHRAALALTGNPWDADDLVQETFLILARRGSNVFEGRSTVYTFLYGILLNLERRNRRRNGLQHRKLRVLWDQEPAERTAPAAETAIEVAEW